MLILLILYGLTILPQLSQDEKLAIAKDFSFQSYSLFEPEGITPKTIRQVHPQYDRISAWISSVGAAVAFTDIDGDLIFNDLIHVDPRYDKVWIEPVPGIARENHYEPIELHPSEVLFDPATMAPMGVLPNDFNEDGQMDVLVYYWGCTPIIFYQDQMNFKPVQLDSSSSRWFSNAGTLADFNGDGHIDILITNYFPNGSKVLDANAKDKDQTMQHSMSRAYNGGTNHLFLCEKDSNGFISFVEAKNWLKDIPHPQDWTLAVGATDFNGDLLPEIYLSNDFGPDKFLFNRSTKDNLQFVPLIGQRKFKSIPSSVLGKDSFKGMGVDFGDINKDGGMDIYVSNIADEYALEESHFAFISTNNWDKAQEGIAPFYNESEVLGLSRSSWGWDSKLADFNNDGQVEAIQATGFVKGEINLWPELQELAIGNDELLSTPEVWPEMQSGIDLSGHDHNPFFIRSSSGRFFDLAPTIGIDQEMVTRGIGTADVDKDGDLDFAYANQWEKSFFYKNNYAGGHKFLGINLLLPIGDQSLEKPLVDPDSLPPFRYAIGAIAKISPPTGPAQIDFVDGGNGHSGVSAAHIHFGLNNLADKEKIPVEVNWIDHRGQAQKMTTRLNPGWHNILLPY